MKDNLLREQMELVRIQTGTSVECQITKIISVDLMKKPLVSLPEVLYFVQSHKRILEESHIEVPEEIHSVEESLKNYINYNFNLVSNDMKRKKGKKNV